MVWVRAEVVARVQAAVVAAMVELASVEVAMVAGPVTATARRADNEGLAAARRVAVAVAASAVARAEVEARQAGPPVQLADSLATEEVVMALAGLAVEALVLVPQGAAAMALVVLETVGAVATARATAALEVAAVAVSEVWVVPALMEVTP